MCVRARVIVLGLRSINRLGKASHWVIGQSINQRWLNCSHAFTQCRCIWELGFNASTGHTIPIETRACPYVSSGQGIFLPCHACVCVFPVSLNFSLRFRSIDRRMQISIENSQCLFHSRGVFFLSLSLSLSLARNLTERLESRLRPARPSFVLPSPLIDSLRKRQQGTAKIMVANYI